jgi:tetratricopeptide (TPR) repeat protein
MLTDILSINWSDFITEMLVALVIGIPTYLNRKKIYRFIKRQKINFFPINFQIVFAIEFDEGLNSGNYFNKIKRDFIKKIYNSGLSSQIKIVDISDVYIFKCKEDAELFRQEKEIDLVIWGDFTYDNLKIDNSVVNKVNLNFTFRLPYNQSNEIKSLLAKDLQSKFAQRAYWQIFESNSLKDIEIVTNNIFNISTYILAVTLEIFGELEKSTILLENLYNDLKRKNDLLWKELIPNLLNCYAILSIEHGSYRKNYPLGINYCKKSLQLDADNFAANSNMALYQYRSGKKEIARQYVEKLKKLNPNSDITLLDVSFFRILEKDYHGFLNGYKKLKRKYRKVSFNIPEVVEFLEEQYEALKEPAILFAFGFLNCEYGDIEVGKDDLKRFLIYADSRVHIELIKETKRLLTIDYKWKQ